MTSSVSITTQKSSAISNESTQKNYLIPSFVDKVDRHVVDKLDKGEIQFFTIKEPGKVGFRAILKDKESSYISVRFFAFYAPASGSTLVVIQQGSPAVISSLDLGAFLQLHNDFYLENAPKIKFFS